MNLNRYLENKQSYLELTKREIDIQINQSGGNHIKLTSSLVDENGRISDKYSKYGSNVSPSIEIRHIPKNTKQMVLLMYDPDAVKVANKTFIHWFCILKPKEYTVSEGDKIGTAINNDFGEDAYGGPKPPKGKGPHTYHLAIYALDDEIDFSSSETYESIKNKIKSHLIDDDEIIGSYESN